MRQISMENDGDDSVADGDEEARGAAVLRPLVQVYLKRTGTNWAALGHAGD